MSAKRSGFKYTKIANSNDADQDESVMLITSCDAPLSDQGEQRILINDSFIIKLLLTSSSHTIYRQQFTR